MTNFFHIFILHKKYPISSRIWTSSFDEQDVVWIHLWVYMEILVPYLDNPSEEAIFQNNKIKEERETMKLLNEEVMLKSTQNLD